MKVKRMKQLFGGPAVILLATLILCCGCVSTRVITKPYTSGRILLLPPRDLVQNGVPHPKGAGSGHVFQSYLKSSFAGTIFELVTTDSKEFSATKIPEKEKGLKEAKRLNAGYCLQVVLGEFLNAAPMTFRPDYVYLDRAIMYDVQTGETVWQLVAPLYLRKGNLGNHLVLLDKLARTVSKSIRKNMQ